MKIRIILVEYPMTSGFDRSIPHLKQIEEILFRMFEVYQPKPSGDTSGTYAYPAYEMAAPVDDPQFKKLLQDFSSVLKNASPPSAAFVCESPVADEIKRARFLEPYFSSDLVDEGSCRKPLNPGLRLCEECDWPNLAHLPEPFLVNKSVLKKHDVFHAGASVIIVRPRVLELLKVAVGDQIQFGEAAIAKAKMQATGDDRLFWVRPKPVLGKSVRLVRGEYSCPVCKRTWSGWIGSTNNKINETGPGLFDDRYRIEHFGSANFDIALIPDDSGKSWPTIIMSGALLAHLKANDVKGIVASTKSLEPRCVFSQKGEPTLEPKARTFAGTTSPAKQKQDKAQLQQARQTTSLLKDVPWDCTHDGYVYFHLSTPEFIVLDPMTVEEDSGGPYVIKDFKGPGLYRLPVSAIKTAEEEKRGVAVDSATLLFVDNLYLDSLLDAYEWEKAMSNGAPDWNYHQHIAEEVGTRFGICTPPPDKFKSAFIGDGFYKIVPKSVKLVKA